MDTQDFVRPIFAPVILGTSRQGRASEHAAGFVVDHVSKRHDIRTELIDIRNIRLSIDDAGEALKDPRFSATVDEADALIFVVQLATTPRGRRGPFDQMSTSTKPSLSGPSALIRVRSHRQPFPF